MNILHINTNMSWRGAEQQVWYLLQADTPSVKNFLFCPQGSALHQRTTGMQNQTGTYIKRSGLGIAGAWRLKAFIKAQGIHLLHIHDSHGLNLSWAARLMGSDVPVVLTRHVSFRPGNAYKYRGDHIRRIICVSHTVKETMATITDPSKLVVIHPGLYLPEVNRIGRLRELFGIGKDGILIGTVCALEKEKDLPLFIRILKEIIVHNPGVYAVIIGEGSMRHTLENQVNQTGLSEHIRFTGFQDNVDQLLPDLDLFLFTSRSEGFGLSVAAAMLAKVPVIARHCGGIDELLNGGRSGRIFRSEAEAVNLIDELISNTAEREELARQGRDRALDFSVAQLIEKTHTLYTEILR